MIAQKIISLFFGRGRNGCCLWLDHGVKEQHLYESLVIILAADF